MEEARLAQRTTAHPRACGENEARREIVVSSSGSSPRVRGKLLLVQHVADDGRLIPARAGKT